MRKDRKRFFITKFSFWPKRTPEQRQCTGPTCATDRQQICNITCETINGLLVCLGHQCQQRSEDADQPGAEVYPEIILPDPPLV